MSLSKEKIEVVGGQMNYKMLTSKTGPKSYAVGKAHCWLNMINKGMRPIRWNKATTKGTKVTFETISTQEGYEQAYGELSDYLEKTNQEYGTDLSLNRNES